MCDKCAQVLDNLEKAKERLGQMLAEFNIGKNLKHPNVVDYKYFMHEYNSVSKKFQVHTLIEILDGQDMDAYLQQPNRTNVIQPAKELGA